MTKFRHACILLILLLAALSTAGQRKVIFKHINSDPLAKTLSWVDKKVSPAEQKCHSLVWKIKEVRELALSVSKQGLHAFTMTDEWPSPESEYYIISFCEIATNDNLMDRYARLKTYRINKRMGIETYNAADDSWIAQR
jgi:hypothetical protein